MVAVSFFPPQINKSKNNSEIFAQLKSNEYKVEMCVIVIFQAIYIHIKNEYI